MKDISLEEMLQSGVHFGHKASRLYPKMKPFVYTSRNGVSIFDLEKTKEKLIFAQEFVKKVAQKRGTVLFVGTKRQAQDIIKGQAEKIKMPFVTEHWVGGTFTNFSVILKMINKFKDLKRQREAGELQKYTKKERLKIDEEIQRLEESIGGIASLSRLPEAIYVVDVKNEMTVVKEAKKKKIPIIAVVDANCNPEGIAYPIPANDDASKSISLITAAIAEAYEEGTKSQPQESKEKETADKAKGKEDKKGK